MSKKVLVVGLGFVGQATAYGLAYLGHEVLGIDRNKAVETNLLKQGVFLPVRNNFRFANSLAAGVAASDIIMICVGTPPSEDAEDGSISLTQLLEVEDEISEVLERMDYREKIIVVRSTVVPGTCEKLFTKHNKVFVAHNPEFLREASFIRDFLNPPLIVVGSDSAHACAQLEELYSNLIQIPLIDNKFQLYFHRTDFRTSEMIKYAFNLFHALKICFANEIGRMSRFLGADGNSVMHAVRSDKMLNCSAAYLVPGEPYGGSCLPKDVNAILALLKTSFNLEPVLLSAIPVSNQK